MTGYGRWSGSASWLLVQLDRASLEESGWEIVWKDAKQEKSIRSSDEGLVIGGYRLANSELVLHLHNIPKRTVLNSKKRKEQDVRLNGPTWILKVTFVLMTEHH